MDDVIELVREWREKDENGISRAYKSSREVFCRMSSISRYEFFSAGRNGLNPQFQFTIAAVDYEDEVIVRFHGKTYGVYRTYYVPGTDYIELYVERKGGTNGKAED